MVVKLEVAVFWRMQSDEVFDSRGSCVWRTRSDNVIDGFKGMVRGLRICCRLL